MTRVLKKKKSIILNYICNLQLTSKGQSHAKPELFKDLKTTGSRENKKKIFLIYCKKISLR